MADLSTLLAQKAELEKQIELMRAETRAKAIEQIRTLMAEHGLTAVDLQSTLTSRSKKTGGGAKVAAKYHNPITGDSWSGRGLQPKWLKAELGSGRKIEEFAV